METDIFRKKVCAICGEVEWKPYIGTQALDGGFTKISNFEPSEYVLVSVDHEHWVVCPKCAKMIVSDIKKLPEAVKNGRMI